MLKISKDLAVLTFDKDMVTGVQIAMTMEIQDNARLRYLNLALAYNM